MAEKQKKANLPAEQPAKRLRKPQPIKPAPIPARVERPVIDPDEYEIEEPLDLSSDTPEVPSAPAPQGAPAIMPAPQGQAPAPGPPPEPRHSSRIVRRAAEVGLSASDIEDMTHEDVLDEILHRQQQMMLWSQGERRESGRSASGQPRQDLFPEQFVDDPEPDQQPKPRDDDDLQLDELTDPAVAAALRRLAKENKELRQQVTSAGEREQQRDRQARNDRIDRFFAGRTDLHDVVGAGSLGELSQEELATRQAILTVAAADTRHIAMEAKLDRAVKIIYRRQAAATPPAGAQGYVQPAAPAAPPAAQQPPPPPKPTNGTGYDEEELAKRRNIWANEAPVAQPTQRQGASEPKGIAAAKKKFVQLSREQGLESNQLSVDETAELPD